MLSQSWIFDTSGFLPRWDCGNWPLWLGWLHIVSDILIWLAYLAIPAVFVYFMRRRDIPVTALFWLFGACIITCGTTHLLEAASFYLPLYRLVGVTKFVTAIACWATIIALVPFIPKALSTRSQQELQSEIATRTAELAIVNADLQKEITERLRIERGLLAERDSFRLTLSSIGDGVVATDSSGRVVFLNEAACALTGWKFEEALGKPLVDVFPLVNEATGEVMGNLVARAMREGKPIALSNSTILRDRHGTERPIDHCGTPILAGGGVAGAVLIFRDVTERRRAEEVRARLAAIVDSSEDAVIGKNLDGTITTWNKAAERLFGYTEEEMLGTPISVLIPPEIADQMPKILEQIRHGKRIHHFETVRIRKDRMSVDVSLSVSPVKDSKGRIVGAAKIARDISDRKRTEKAFLRSEARFRTLVDAIPDAVIINVNGCVVFCNPACVRLLGATDQNQILGKALCDLYPPEYHQKILERIAVMSAGKSSGQRQEEKVVRLDGRTVPVYITLVPITDRGDDAILVVLHDLSDRKQLEDQFRQAQKMEAVGLLAGGVAHDFNNLLCIINGYGAMLLAQMPANDAACPMILQMTQAGERAAGLTRQLLAFSRKAVLAPEVLNLNEVVTNMATMLRRTIGEDISLVVNLQSDLCHVKVDVSQVEQVLLNLVVNARDAMPTGGKLTIESHNVHLDDEYTGRQPEVRLGRYALLAVSDTGHGISEEVRAHLFEPFFTTKEKGKGTGLGLATVHGIVNQSGGTIDVDSKQGVGTCFKVYLPCVDKEETQKKSPSKQFPATLGGETVLLVEDEAGVRALTRMVLLKNGYVVLEASHAAQALQVAEGHSGTIHLLVSDVVMPDLGGPALAGRLLSLHPEMKVMFLSGYTDDALVRHGVLLEKVNFLQKPFTPSGLALKVRAVLDTST